MFDRLTRHFEERPAGIYVPSPELDSPDYSTLTDEERDLLTSQLQIPPAPGAPEDNRPD